DRCRDGSIHQARCGHEHLGNIRAPLLLYDPRLDFAIYSPAPLVDDLQARTEGALLVDRLRDSVSAAERDRTVRNIEVVPREMLGAVLSSSQLNVQDFAPGADRNAELEAVYQLLRASDFEALLSVIESGKAPPVHMAALRFEAGMRFNRME